MVDCCSCAHFYEYVNKAGGFAGFCSYYKRQVKNTKRSSCRAYTPKDGGGD